MLLMTNASWKMMQWLSEYAGLMRLLPSDASRIYSGCCQLFELYFLHVFYCYSEVPLVELFRKDGYQQVFSFPFHPGISSIPQAKPEPRVYPELSLAISRSKKQFLPCDKKWRTEIHQMWNIQVSHFILKYGRSTHWNEEH